MNILLNLIEEDNKSISYPMAFICLNLFSFEVNCKIIFKYEF